MKNLYTLLVLALLIPTAQAQLAPDSYAPLAAHLMEVNKEWQKHPDALSFLDGTSAHFNKEADRIATHLVVLSEYLMSHAPEGLSPVQAEERYTLLERLQDYANEGRFPQNEVLTYRNPIFIDPYGTACAVGWLMIESGHDALAEEISASMDQAYVLDMRHTELWPSIGSWANEHGFAPEELAWIQPGYPPSTQWAPLGGGTNGDVRVLLTMQDGTVLVGGSFSEAGGIAAQQVALWNGSYLTPMGNGLQGEVNCAVEFNGSLYVGGALLSDVNDLAAWDGSSWTFSTVTDGKLPWVNALHVHNGQLYAAGETMGFAGVDHRVQRFNGSTWEAVGMPLNGKIRAMESFNGELIIGGEFTDHQFAQGDTIKHIARLVGNEWQQLGNGLKANVHDLIIHDEALHASGGLFVNMLPTFGLARLDVGQSTWEALLPEHASYMDAALGSLYINAMTTHNGQLFVAGNFDTMGMMLIGNNIALFNGDPDGLEPLAMLDEPVLALAVSNNMLIIGGEFNAELSHLAVTDFSTGISPETDAGIVLELFPSPSNTQLNIRCAGLDLSKAVVSVLDMNGRQITLSLERQREQLVMDVQPIAAGSYVVQLSAEGRSYQERFVKE